jgi:hypothetical protein
MRIAKKFEHVTGMKMKIKFQLSVCYILFFWQSGSIQPVIRVNWMPLKYADVLREQNHLHDESFS